MFKFLVLLLFRTQVGLAADPLHPLPTLPSSYSASLMWNIRATIADGEHKGDVIASTFSVLETIDEIKGMSLIETERELNFVNEDNETVYYIEYEKIIWKPGVHGVNRFMDIFTIQNGEISGLFCSVDTARDEGFINFLFGFDFNDDSWFPSVSHMLHWKAENYTFSGPEIVNGVETDKYSGHWLIPELNADLSVNYFWSNSARWASTAGENISAPISITVEGPVEIKGVKSQIQMNIEFSDFYEASFPESYFNPPADLWCENRAMQDNLTKLTDTFMFESEMVFSFKDLEGEQTHIILPRTEWYDNRNQVSRVDYKPPDLSHASPDPFLNDNGYVTQIHDFNTGIMYSIDQTYGNCTVEYLDESADGIDAHGHGHVHMMSPFYMFFNGDKFAYNGQSTQRGFETDVFIRSAPMLKNSSSENYTTVVMLTGSKWEVENQHQQEFFIPAQIVRYPNDKYGQEDYRMTVNYYNLREGSFSFDDLDLTPCYSDTEKMHLLVRLGWTSEMTVDKELKAFYTNARTSVVTWGMITPIRVQNIQVYVDTETSSMFVLFTILGYPPNIQPIPEELPDAYRPLDEVYGHIADAVKKGWFKIEVPSKNGGTLAAQAEAGSLTELGDRGGLITYKDGYSSGAMAACGIILLMVSIAGFAALLVFVLKF